MERLGRALIIIVFLLTALAANSLFAAVRCQQVFSAEPVAWGYHASPELNLSVLDPAFSRNTSRYGPGVYLYASDLAVKDHARSIREGRIKYDKTARPSRVYKVRIKLKNVLDTTDVYTVQELNYVLSRLPASAKKLGLNSLQKITGQDFYDRLTTYFAKTMPIILERGVVAAPTPKAKVNLLLKEAGIEVLIGQIPVPKSSRFEKAYISLLPISLQP